MQNIEKKLQKRIDTIIELTGEYPKELKITKEEAKQINNTSFRNVKLIIQ